MNHTLTISNELIQHGTSFSTTLVECILTWTLDANQTFFKEVMEALSSTNNRWYGSPYLTVMYSTGSMFISLVYNSLSAEQQKNVLILPPELYSERKTRYFKHLRGSTWHSSDALLIQHITRHWLLLSSSILVLLVVYNRMARHRKPKHDCNKIM